MQIQKIFRARLSDAVVHKRDRLAGQTGKAVRMFGKTSAGKKTVKGSGKEMDARQPCKTRQQSPAGKLLPKQDERIHSGANAAGLIFHAHEHEGVGLAQTRPSEPGRIGRDVMPIYRPAGAQLFVVVDFAGTQTAFAIVENLDHLIALPEGYTIPRSFQIILIAGLLQQKLTARPGA